MTEPDGPLLECRDLACGYGSMAAELAGALGDAGILPWVLASAVVAFLIAEHRRTTAALLDANTRLAHAVEEQGKALEGVRALLGSQGYTLPPLSKPQ